MTHPTYDTYKDSGIPWLGDIPVHWEVKKIGHGFDVIGSGTTPKADISNYYGGNIPWITTSELKEDIIFNSKSYITKHALDRYPALKLYKASSLLIAMYGATIGRLGMLGVDSTVNQACCVFDSPRKFITQFMFYFFQSAKPVLLSESLGSGQPNLSLDLLKNFKATCPPLPEQQAIADFLDKQTAQIDTIITKKERLIALLREYRTALITHTVTKGINPNTKTKPSNIKWLGNIPEHWEVKRLKFLGDSIIGLTYSPNDIVDEEEGTLVLRATNIQNDKIMLTNNVYVKMNIPNKLITRIGDILICSRNGSRDLIGKNALITEQSAGHSFGAFTTVFRTEYYDYIYYILHSELFKYQSASFLTTTVNQLTTGVLNNFEVLIPSISEQQEIARYLDTETKKIDKTIAKSQQMVDTLKQYRTAIITHAVTGKIKVV